MLFSDQMTNMIDKLRRALGDIDTEQTFTKDILGQYLSDAIDQLELGDYVKGISVVDGEIVDISGIEVIISTKEENIYVLMAQILLKLGVKDRADRENFSLSKGQLRVDTSGQSADHQKTLESLQERLNRAIYNVTAGDITGVRVE